MSGVDKHSSLLRHGINYGLKKFYRTGRLEGFEKVQFYTNFEKRLFKKFVEEKKYNFEWCQLLSTFFLNNQSLSLRGIKVIVCACEGATTILQINFVLTTYF